MGYHSSRKRPRDLGVADVIAILLVVAAVIGLVVWIIENAGGGHFVF